MNAGFSDKNTKICVYQRISASLSAHRFKAKLCWIVTMFEPPLPHPQLYKLYRLHKLYNSNKLHKLPYDLTGFSNVCLSQRPV